MTSLYYISLHLESGRNPVSQNAYAFIRAYRKEVGNLFGIVAN